MYTKAYHAIRADPSPAAKADKNVAKKSWNAKKLTLAERKAKVTKAKEDFLEQLEAMKE